MWSLTPEVHLLPCSFLSLCLCLSLYLGLTVHPSTCLPVCLSLCLFVLSVCMSLCLSPYHSLCLSASHALWPLRVAADPSCSGESRLITRPVPHSTSGLCPLRERPLRQDAGLWRNNTCLVPASRAGLWPYVASWPGVLCTQLVQRAGLRQCVQHSCAPMQQPGLWPYGATATF